MYFRAPWFGIFGRGYLGYALLTLLYLNTEVRPLLPDDGKHFSSPQSECRIWKFRRQTRSLNKNPNSRSSNFRMSWIWRFGHCSLSLTTDNVSASHNQNVEYGNSEDGQEALTWRPNSRSSNFRMLSSQTPTTTPNELISFILFQQRSEMWVHVDSREFWNWTWFQYSWAWSIFLTGCTIVRGHYRIYSSRREALQLATAMVTVSWDVWIWEFLHCSLTTDKKPEVQKLEFQKSTTRMVKMKFRKDGQKAWTEK